MPLLNTGGAAGAAPVLTASAASFVAGIPAGATIATLSDPFGGGASYAVAGAAPAALALDGNRIVTGAGASAGTSYAIKVRATSADGRREVAETFTLAAIAATAARITTSASVRARMANTTTAVGPNNVQVQRIRDIANADVADPSIELWNGMVAVGVAAPASPEVGPGNATPYRACLLTGLNGTSRDQSSATLTVLTFAQAGACTAGYIWKLDGTPPTPAEFTAAGGAVSADNRQITVPSGWRVRSDRAAGLTIAARTPFMWQVEDAISNGGRRPVGAWMRSDLGELTKAATASGSYAYTKDFSTLSGVDGAAKQVSTPVAIWGETTTGRAPVAVVGDSIVCEVNDSAYGGVAVKGDADGATAFARRALNAAQLPSVCTAIPGDAASTAKTATEAGNGGHAQRELSLRFSKAVISDMGHNDRGAFGSLDAYKAMYRWYWGRLRAACLGGTGRVVQTDLLPKTTSSDGFATSAGQTDSAGSVQYAIINPFLQAGSFQPASGDPDASFGLNAALYQWAAGVSPALDIDAAPHRRWPANGGANTSAGGYAAVAFDGSHPKGPAHAGIADILVAQLSSLLAL